MNMDMCILETTVPNCNVTVIILYMFFREIVSIKPKYKGWNLLETRIISLKVICWYQDNMTLAFGSTVNPSRSTRFVKLVSSLVLFHFTVLSATKAGSSSSPGPSSSPAKVSQGSALSTQLCDLQHKDCLFREFRKLCAMVAEHNSYNVKTQIIEKFLKKGTGGGWCANQFFCFYRVCGL